VLGCCPLLCGSFGIIGVIVFLVGFVVTAAGRFTERVDLQSSAECDLCPAGVACLPGTGGGQPPVPCGAGYYCPVGTQSATQYACPIGRFSSSTNLQAASNCTVCPAGSFCSGGQTTISGACRQGHFCPQGTGRANDFPCIAGTFSARTDLQAADQCSPCPVGSYCPVGSSVTTQCPAGTYTNVTNTASPGSAASATSFPACTTCPAGFFCPVGSVNPLPCGLGNASNAGASSCVTCPVGYYCDQAATPLAVALLSKPCPAGMFCPAGQSKMPELTNNACPAGHFCVSAVSAPQACSAGTWNPVTGATNASYCMTCPAGSYCTSASSSVTGFCAPGHYCPPGSVTNQTFPCPSQYYRAHPGARSLQDCAICPAGSSCGVATVDPVACPAGSYCVTGVDTPENCPPGTFGNSTGLRRVEDCTPCLPGSYCDGSGLTAPRGPCDPGYYCLEGSSTPAPIDPDDPLSGKPIPTGGMCPSGGYCPIGSSKPTSCPEGTFNNVTGAFDATFCIACLPVSGDSSWCLCYVCVVPRFDALLPTQGYYCQGSSNPFPTARCDDGHYCTGGSSVPTQFMTPAGFYSLSGDSSPRPCPPGTYQTARGQAGCLSCEAKYFCPNQSTVVLSPCSPGGFCPPGSSAPVPCPAGTFSSDVGQCKPCTPGMYCPSDGLVGPVGGCSAGFYCTGGAIIPNPGQNGTAQSYGAPCPVGAYCPVGTTVPFPCPAGTFNPVIGAANISFCQPCSAGKACVGTGLHTPDADCTAGYYCASGATTTTPMFAFLANPSGGRCPLGSYCPTGSSGPLPCEAGTYTNVTTSVTCSTCPSRYYCPFTGMHSPLSCPLGSYCPSGTGATTQLCPVGTFGNATQVCFTERRVTDNSPG
jgi:hypothetical protein